MEVRIDYYKRNPYREGVGIINHITITEDDILELAKERTKEDDYELHGYIIDKVICD